jgi:hypothetical protein
MHASLTIMTLSTMVFIFFHLNSPYDAYYIVHYLYSFATKHKRGPTSSPNLRY